MQWKYETRPPADQNGDIQDFIQSPEFYIMNRMLRNGEVFSSEGNETKNRETTTAEAEDGKFVFFWKLHHKNEEFSNWYPKNFVVEGIKYNCVEQYMMAKTIVSSQDFSYFRHKLISNIREFCEKYLNNDEDILGHLPDVQREEVISYLCTSTAMYEYLSAIDNGHSTKTFCS